MEISAPLEHRSRHEATLLSILLRIMFTPEVCTIQEERKIRDAATDTLDVWHAAVVDAPVFLQFLGVSGRGDVRLRKVA